MLRLEAEMAELRATIEKLATGSKNMSADYKRVEVKMGKQAAFLVLAFRA